MWPCNDGMVNHFCTVAAEDVDSERRLACFPLQSRPIRHLSPRREPPTKRTHSAAKAADHWSNSERSPHRIDRRNWWECRRIETCRGRQAADAVVLRCRSRFVDALTSRTRFSVVGVPSVTWSPERVNKRPTKPTFYLFIFNLFKQKVHGAAPPKNMYFLWHESNQSQQCYQTLKAS